MFVQNNYYTFIVTLDRKLIQLDLHGDRKILILFTLLAFLYKQECWMWKYVQTMLLIRVWLVSGTDYIVPSGSSVRQSYIRGTRILARANARTSGVRCSDALRSGARPLRSRQTGGVQGRAVRPASAVQVRVQRSRRTHRRREEPAGGTRRRRRPRSLQPAGARRFQTYRPVLGRPRARLQRGRAQRTQHASSASEIRASSGLRARSGVLTRSGLLARSGVLVTLLESPDTENRCNNSVFAYLKLHL